MRRILTVFAALCLLAAPACSKRAPATSDEVAVRAVLSRYVSSLEREDLDLYAQLVASDPVMVNFGAFGDPILGWDGLKEAMAEQNRTYDNTRITVREVRVHVVPSAGVAWATSLWDFTTTNGGRQMHLPVRCSWVLEKREGAWVIVHFHKSVAA